MLINLNSKYLNVGKSSLVLNYKKIFWQEESNESGNMNTKLFHANFLLFRLAITQSQAHKSELVYKMQTTAKF
jgi:hypothetical protein